MSFRPYLVSTTGSRLFVLVRETYTIKHTRTKNQDGRTALIIASSAGRVEVVQELIKAGANLEAKKRVSIVMFVAM